MSQAFVALIGTFSIPADVWISVKCVEDVEGTKIVGSAAFMRGKYIQISLRCLIVGNWPRTIMQWPVRLSVCSLMRKI